MSFAPSYLRPVSSFALNIAIEPKVIAPQKNASSSTAIPKLELMLLTYARYSSINEIDDALRMIKGLAPKLAGGQRLETAADDMHDLLVDFKNLIEFMFHSSILPKEALSDFHRKLRAFCVAVQSLRTILKEYPKYWEDDDIDKLDYLTEALEEHIARTDMNSSWKKSLEARLSTLKSTLDALGESFEAVIRPLQLFAEHGIPPLVTQQENETTNMLGIITIATFQSGVTIAGIQTTANGGPSALIAVVNAFWFFSLECSVLAAILQLAGFWWFRSATRQLKSVPSVIDFVMRSFSIVLVAFATMTFIIGLTVFSWTSSQHRAVAVLTTAVSGGVIIFLVFVVDWVFRTRSKLKSVKPPKNSAYLTPGKALPMQWSPDGRFLLVKLSYNDLARTRAKILIYDLSDRKRPEFSRDHLADRARYRFYLETSVPLVQAKCQASDGKLARDYELGVELLVQGLRQDRGMPDKSQSSRSSSQTRSPGSFKDKDAEQHPDGLCLYNPFSGRRIDPCCTLPSMDGKTMTISSVALSPERYLFVTGNFQNNTESVPTSSVNILVDVSSGHPGYRWPTKETISREGDSIFRGNGWFGSEDRHLLRMDADENIRVWKREKSSPAMIIAPSEFCPLPILSFAVDPSSKALRVALAFSDKSVRVLFVEWEQVPDRRGEANSDTSFVIDLSQPEDSLESEYVDAYVDVIGSSHSTFTLNKLGNSLYSRFYRFGALQDLEDAINAQQRALTTSILTPDAPFLESSILSSLGSSLYSRYSLYKDLEDLQHAIEVQERAVELTPNSLPEKLSRCDNLSIFLHTRFEMFRMPNDLEVAIKAAAPRTVARRDLDMVQLTAGGNPETPARFAHLAAVLYSRFSRSKKSSDNEDLDYAIAIQRRVLELTSEDHPEMVSRLNSLAVFLCSRFNLVHQLPILNEAITVQQRTTELARSECRENPSHLINLGEYLRLRHDSDRVDRHRFRLLKDAIQIKHRAIDLIPCGHPYRSYCYHTLGISMLCQLRCYPSSYHFISAYVCFQGSYAAAAAPPEKLRAALSTIDMCTEFSQFDKSSVFLLQAYESMIDTLPAFWFQADQNGSTSPIYEDSEFLRTKISSMVTTAVSVAIDTGNISMALKWLEVKMNIQVVWGPSTGARLHDPLRALPPNDRYKVEKLKELSRALSNAEWGSVRDGASFPFSDTPEDDARKHRKQVAEYRRVLDKIRQIVGFESFLRPKTAQELALACEDGPIALINIDGSRSDALTLCQSGKVTHSPLPGLTLELADRMNTSLKTSLIKTSYHGDSVRAQEYQRAADQMRTILGDLRELVVLPVLASIKEELASAPSRKLLHITWCVTDSLSFLPLHAAGAYNSGASSNEGALKTSKPIQIVSSYTPSVSALLTGHMLSPSESQPHFEQPNILVISEPKTYWLEPLPGSAEEANAILKQFPNNTTCLINTEVTLDTVLSEMPQHSWIHIAYYYDIFNQSSPEFTKGGPLGLRDHPLDLSQISDAAHEGVSLAVLSARHTSKTVPVNGTDDLRVPEQLKALHLAAEMLSVGYRSVIVPLWSIADEDGPEFAREFYTALKRNHEKHNKLDVAYALYETIECLRDQFGENRIEQWAQFVHVGV
ncbi:CHAT domain-containing protein [Vararia minispora EC-137]|uniref:CHAT domain-containing protein n=1 Tax=Vararia minispora EC-137 TaxID=1314806 RepID=A0ACB8Q856_9AGAM|nr:CHAT domain-containing protein [Vararia minispora EC-137]